MSIEKLFTPRWKVINDYPGMESNGMYKIGDILTDNGVTAVMKEDGNPVFACDWVNYPHLFKKLEWWEERTIDEMPRYLKFYDEVGTLEFVLKAENYLTHKGTNIFWAFQYKWEREPDLKSMSLHGWLPATEEECVKQNAPATPHTAASDIV